MSSLTDKQLADLTTLINCRRDEFDEAHLPPLSLGTVRQTIDVYEAWLDQRAEAAMLEGDRAGHRRFASVTPKGRAFSITGDPSMDGETERALGEMMDAVYEKLSDDAGSPDATIPVTDDPEGDPPPPPPELAGDIGELAEAWPTMPNLNGGIDHFAEHGVTGEHDAHAQPPDEYAASLSSQSIHATDDEIASARMGADERARQYREIIYALTEMALDGVMPGQDYWNTNKPAELPTVATILSRYDLANWAELAERAKLKYMGKAAPRRGRVATT